jgi:hypothetical protein
MTGGLSPIPHLQFLDNSGAVLSGGTLSTYAAGTDTLLATYADSALTIENPTEITLNSAGRPSNSGVEIPIYLGPYAYKFRLKSVTGATIWTQDNIANGEQSTFANPVTFQSNITVSNVIMSGNLYDANSHLYIQLLPQASADTYLQLINGAAGGLSLAALGEAKTQMLLGVSGEATWAESNAETGPMVFITGNVLGSLNVVMQFVPITEGGYHGVNFWRANSNIATGPVKFIAVGPGHDGGKVDAVIGNQHTGTITFGGNMGNDIELVLHTQASAVEGVDLNYLEYINATATGTATPSNPTWWASGPDSNIGIAFTPKGTGGVGVGDFSSTPLTSKFQVVAGTASLRIGYNNTSYNYLDADNQIFRNGAGNATLLTLASAGATFGGTITAASLGVDTGTALVVNGSGLIKVSSSSEKYKNIIQRNWMPTKADSKKFFSLAPITFTYKDSASKTPVLGFSAEDAAKVPMLTNCNSQGKPESIRQDAMIAYLFNEVKSLRAEIEKLKSKK